MGSAWMPRLNRASLWNSSATCTASSRVGHRMSTCTARKWGSVFSMAGTAKAAVLPEPVWDCPTTSWPASRMGMASAWMGEACSNPSLSIAFKSSGESPNSENNFLFITLKDASAFQVSQSPVTITSGHLAHARGRPLPGRSLIAKHRRYRITQLENQTVKMTHPSNDLAKHLELTLFAADATRADIERICAEARNGNFFGVCMNGSNVELARALLDESSVQVVALVGFPLGAGDVDTKRFETEVAA